MIPAFIAHYANEKRKTDDEERRPELYQQLELPMYNEPDDDDFDDDEDEPETLQSKGGSMPAQPSPQAEARAQIQIEEARAAREAEQERIRQEREEAERAALIEKATGKQMEGYNAARAYGTNRINQLGFDDTYGILNAYYSELDRIRPTIGETVTDTSPYYTESLFDDSLSAVQNAERTRMMNAFNSSYAPDFSLDLFTPESDDAIIADILSQREADARSSIDRAYARGKFDDQGLARALSGLTEQRSSAESRLQGIGGDVLGTTRKGIEDFAQGTRDSIGNYTLGSYDPTANFGTRLDSRVSEAQSGLRGNILDALGSTSLFDPSSLLVKAGEATGITNTAPTTSTLGSTSATTAAANRNKTNVGAF